MREKLKEVALRYEDLQAQLGDPAVYGDSERVKAVTRELKELEPVVAAWQPIISALARSSTVAMGESSFTMTTCTPVA